MECKSNKLIWSGAQRESRLPILVVRAQPAVQWTSRVLKCCELLVTKDCIRWSGVSGEEKIKKRLNELSSYSRFSALLRGSLSELVSEKITEWIWMKSPDTPVVKATG